MINDLKIEERVVELCKKNSWNIDFLKILFKARTRGFNNAELATKLGVHRVTIQRYMETLRKLTESEFETLHKYLSRTKDDTGV